MAYDLLSFLAFSMIEKLFYYLQKPAITMSLERKYKYKDNWQEFYFHDSPTNTMEFRNNEIAFELEFVHVRSEHPDNTFGKTICGLEVLLTIKGISELQITSYLSLEGGRTVELSTDEVSFLEIINTDLTDDGYFIIQGFNDSKIGGWCTIKFKAIKTELSFDKTGESWVNK